MLKITYFGTTTLLFDDGTDQVFFDAHFTRPSMITYARGGEASTDTALCDKMIKLHRIDRLRAIFISHTHHDHVMDAPYIAVKCGAKIYGSESARNVALGGGVPEENIAVFQHGSSFTVGDYKVSILKSLHSKPTIFNNDLGEPITKPLVQPASLRAYKEGGSYDFFVEHGEHKILIRPSFNYIKGQLDGIKADVLFLGGWAAGRFARFTGCQAPSPAPYLSRLILFSDCNTRARILNEEVHIVGLAVSCRSEKDTFRIFYKFRHTCDRAV